MNRILFTAHLYPLRVKGKQIQIHNIWNTAYIVNMRKSFAYMNGGEEKKKEKWCTVKILKFETPQTIAIIVLKIEKFDVTLH